MPSRRPATVAGNGQSTGLLAGVRRHSPSPQSVERRTKEIGRELFETDRPWAQALAARLVGGSVHRRDAQRSAGSSSALPVHRRAAGTQAPEAVRRHLAEYLAEAGDRVPWWLGLGLRLALRVRHGRIGWPAAARASAGLMARKFIAGATPEQAIQTVLSLRRRRLAFTADLLGEAVISEAEADIYQQTCLSLIRGPGGAAQVRPRDPLDRPRSARADSAHQPLAQTVELDRSFRADPRRDSIDRVARRLRPILRAARELGAYIHVDMEQYAYRALSYELFCRVLEEAEFRDWPDVGIVVQAYHSDAERELRMLRDWVERRGAPITVRLVKGAYWDYEVLTARRLGWPEPVYLQKWQSDACFERCARFLLENHDQLRPAFGSHNVRSLSHSIAAAEALGLPQAAYELQTLFGMGDLIQRRWRAAAIACGFIRRMVPCCPAWRTWCGVSWRIRRTNRS